jgi:ABC-type sugar transport system substrate-binding protein
LGLFSAVAHWCNFCPHGSQKEYKENIMKRISLPLVAVLSFLLLIFAGCRAAATPETLAAEAQPTVASLADTAAPAPVATPTPTEPPPPLSCMIAFDSDRDGNREVYIMGPDGKDPLNLTGNPGDDFDPSWSPDGSRIAFVSNRANEQGGGQFIYVMNADGSGARQLNQENESKWPDWSHDGSRITYTAQGDIYVINADGSGQAINLTSSPEDDQQSTWSPDGSQIAWLSGSDRNWNIFVMNADGSNVRRLTDDGKVADVQWTVDGQLFTHWDNQKAGCFNCVLAADGSNIRDAGGKGEVQRYLPFWTRDGQRVECVEGDLNGRDAEIYLVGEIFPDIFFNLTNNPAHDRNPDWPANCGPGVGGAALESDRPKTPDQVVIGYAGDDPWQPERKANFQKACAELGIRCVYGEIPELIEQGVSAIVQNSNHIAAPGLHQDILNARDKGIPVILLDAEVITHGAYSVTIDHHAWAKTGLEWMFEKMGGEGQIAYFDLHPFNQYSDTINELLAKYPAITVVEHREGAYDREKVKPETVDFAKNYPELKAVWTSYNMANAIRGLDESGISAEEWPLVNCEATGEGLETWAEIKKSHPNFDCIALANPPGIAYDAVYVAYYLASGAQIDESVLGGQYGRSLYVNIPVITGDNLQEWLDKTRSENSAVVDELMTPEEIREKWFLE